MYTHYIAKGVPNKTTVGKKSTTNAPKFTLQSTQRFTSETETLVCPVEFPAGWLVAVKDGTVPDSLAMLHLDSN